MSEHYDRAEEALAWEPEPLQADREQILNDAYDTICEMVDNEEISLDEANQLYEQWRQMYGY